MITSLILANLPLSMQPKITWREKKQLFHLIMHSFKLNFYFFIKSGAFDLCLSHLITIIIFSKNKVLYWILYIFKVRNCFFLLLGGEYRSSEAHTIRLQPMYGYVLLYEVICRPLEHSSITEHFSTLSLSFLTFEHF